MNLNLAAFKFLLIFVCFSCINIPSKKDLHGSASDSPSWAEKAVKTYMIDYPELGDLEGEKIHWGYTQGLTGLAFLRMWEHTGDSMYLYYVKIISIA